MYNVRRLLIHNISELLCGKRGRSYGHRPQNPETSYENILQGLRRLEDHAAFGKGAKRWAEFFSTTPFGKADEEELKKFNRFATSLPRN